MPQYNSSKKHLVLISQHGISFLLPSTQDQRGFPVLCGDLSEVALLLLRVRRCPCKLRDTRGFPWCFCEEQTNFDGPNRAFWQGKRGRFRSCPGREGVWNIWGVIPSLSAPPRVSSGHHFPKLRSSPALRGSGGDQSKGCSSPVLAPLLILLQLQFRPHWCSWAGS